MHLRRPAQRSLIGVAVIAVVTATLLAPAPAGAAQPSRFCRAVSDFNGTRSNSDRASVQALRKLAQASPRDLQPAVRVILQSAKRTDATSALIDAAQPSTATADPVTVAGATLVEASTQRCGLALHFGSGVPTGTSERKVKAAAWVRTVCTSLASWGSSLRDAGLSLATPGGGLTTTLPTERGLVQQFVAAAVTRTAQLLVEVTGAGTPAAPQGAAYAAYLRDGVSKAHEAFVTAQPAAATLSDDIGIFQTQAQTLVQRLDNAGTGVEALVREANTQLGDRLLVRAFAAEPSCSGVA